MEQQQLYAEAGCKPKTGIREYGIRAGMLALAVVLAFVALFTSAGFLIKLAAVAGFAALVYWYPNLKVEYEYIFCDGQLDFDKIMGGARRKTLLQLDFEKIELITPAASHAAQGYREAKAFDFSSREEKPNTYVILCQVKEQRAKIYFEPSEQMLSAMQTKAPRKVERSS